MSSVISRPSTIATITSCEILNSLTEEERAALLDQSFMALAERGDAIWRAGETCRIVAVVGQGFVKMTRTTQQGSGVAVELLGPGQCLGLLVAFNERPYLFSAIAVTQTWYLKIPVRLLVEIYNSNTIFRGSIEQELAPRLRKAQDMMARMSSGRVEQRIANVLLILSETYGETQAKGTRISVPLTRQDLAEMAGTTVETTIRIMSKFQKGGTVSTEKQMITVLNPASLNAAFLA